MSLHWNHERRTSGAAKEKRGKKGLLFTGKREGKKKKKSSSPTSPPKGDAPTITIQLQEKGRRLYKENKHTPKGGVEKSTRRRRSSEKK